MDPQKAQKSQTWQREPVMPAPGLETKEPQRLTGRPVQSRRLQVQWETVSENKLATTLRRH